MATTSTTCLHAPRVTAAVSRITAVVMADSVRAAVVSARTAVAAVHRVAVIVRAAVAVARAKAASTAAAAPAAGKTLSGSGGIFARVPPYLEGIGPDTHVIAFSYSRRPSCRLIRALVPVVCVTLGFCGFSAQAAELPGLVPQALSLDAQRGLAMQAPAAPAEALPAPAANESTRIARSSVNALGFKSTAVLVVDQDSGETVAAKNADRVLPIASLTKLMTALVVIESAQPMDEVLQISSEDVDTEKHTLSRLRVGTRLSRDELLLLALMSSENRAAMALSRHYPGGRPAFLAAMNAKARKLDMHFSHFADPAGLSMHSVSTARDLHRLLTAAYAQPLIRNYSTQTKGTVKVNQRKLTFINSNRMVRASNDWDIELQKTGFTNEAGRCLVMQATVESRRLAMVFLDSAGKLTRYGDAARVRKKIAQQAKTAQRQPAHAVAASAS